MLSYALAIAIALSSLVLFSTAFVMSDIHRQDDFLWSGVGLIYALVLWFCARNITGAVLLGQAAASVLLISYNWQTLKLRKAIANPEKAAQIHNFSVLKAINGLWQRDRATKPPEVTVSESAAKVTESEIAIPDTSTKKNTDATPSKPPQAKKSLRKFWGKKPQGVTKDQLNEILDEEEVTPVPNAADTQTKPKPESKITPVTTETISEQPAATELDAPEQVESTSNQPSTISSPQVISEANAEPIAAAEISPPKPVEKVSTTPPAATSNTVTDQDNEESPTTPATQADPESNNSETDINSPAIIKTEIKIVEVKLSESPSRLDNLETVEVAEVLEAMPEDRSHPRNEDNSNIIEVSTTEIEPDSEDKNPPSSASTD